MLVWIHPDTFLLGGIEFVCRALMRGFPSTPERMLLVKSRWQAEWYVQFLRHLGPQSVIETGAFALANCYGPPERALLAEEVQAPMA